MASGRILHGARGGVHVLRFVGDVRYPLAPALEALVDRVFTGGEVAGFVLDLTETESIDSTNLGSIARIANRLKAAGAPRATVVFASDDIDTVLTSMGLRSIFDFARADQRGVASADDLVESGTPAPDALAHTMLEAHRALMALSEANREQFRDVVAMLERETRADSAADSSQG